VVIPFNQRTKKPDELMSLLEAVSSFFYINVFYFFVLFGGIRTWRFFDRLKSGTTVFALPSRT
jgi:hypothetical protein